MSAVIAPFDASGIVLRQSGTSSTLEATVGLLSPMTFTCVFGKSCAEEPNGTSKPIAMVLTMRGSIGDPPSGHSLTNRLFRASHDDRRRIPQPHDRLGNSVYRSSRGPSRRPDARFARYVAV